VPAAAVAAIIALVPMFGTLAPFSWFIGAAIAAGLYWILMVRAPSHVITPQASIP
jgi:NCS1 family nucleobase:cation symporter-1